MERHHQYQAIEQLPHGEPLILGWVAQNVEADVQNM